MEQRVNIADLKIERFADKTVAAFNASLADADSILGLGSVAAQSTATAAALIIKSIRKTASDAVELKEAEANLDKAREYFIHLVDEENKAKLPLEKRLAQNADDAEIEAGYRTACAIIGDLMYSTIDVLNVLDSISELLCPCTAYLCASAVFYAKTAMESIRLLQAEYSVHMNEPVYARTTRREPEIAIENSAELCAKLIAKFEGMIK